MPSNVTPNYQLNQWAPGDQVQRVDFNADNAKIDAAIKAVDTKAAAKAEQSALTAETNTRVTQVASINTKINAINAALPKKGNCQLYHTSYVGDGEPTKTLTFPQKPLLVFIMTERFYMHLTQGVPLAVVTNGFTTGTFNDVIWSGNSVTWTFNVGNNHTEECCNTKGWTYQLIAFIDASE